MFARHQIRQAGNATHNYVLLIGVALLFILAWLFQQNTIFNWDVSWLLEASQRLLAGGTYLENFFDNNPPLIIYFYIPPVLFAKLFNLNVMIALQFYIYLLISIALSLSYFFIKRIYHHNLQIISVLLFALALVLLFLPLREFGQREHIFLMTMMPYIFLLCYRLENHPVSKKLALTIGIFAAWGLCLKPFFLFTLLLLEGYYCLQRKYFSALFRIETITIAAFAVIYLGLVLYLHADYLAIVVPFATAAHWYYGADWLNWYQLITHPLVYYFGLILLLTYVYHHHKNQSHLIHLLKLALLGFVLSYLLQRADYYYHLLPALAASIIMAIVFYCDLLIEKKPNYKQLFWICLSSMIYLYYLVSHHFHLAMLLPFYREHTFDLFYLLIPLIYLFLYRVHAEHSRSLRELMLGLFAIYLFVYSILQTGYYTYHFAVIILFIAIIFTMVMPANVPVWRRMLFFILGTLWFSGPYTFIFMIHMQDIQVKKRLHTLEKFLQNNVGHQPVYYLTTDIVYAYPALAYSHTGAISVSRFSHLWMVPNLYAPSHSTPQVLQDKMNKVNLILSLITDDLQRSKPEYIFVDVKQNKTKFFTTELVNGNYVRHHWDFDYVREFSKHAGFREAWQSYAYFTNVSAEWGIFRNKLYDFAVYKRIK